MIRRPVSRLGRPRILDPPPRESLSAAELARTLAQLGELLQNGRLTEGEYRARAAMVIASSA